MKKSICIFLSVMILFSFACCAKDNEGTSAVEVSISEITTNITESQSVEPITQSTAKATTESTTEAITETTASQYSETSASEYFSATKAETTKKETTKAVTEITSTETTKKIENVCYVTIDCHTINDNLGDLTKGKESFVPKDGIILNNKEVEFNGGATAFDVIKKACEENTCEEGCKYCQKNGIQLEYTYTPAYSSYYIEGVHQLYEMDCGSMSGWMVLLNGKILSESSSTIKISQGDKVSLIYTCDMGDDIGIKF